MCKLSLVQSVCTKWFEPSILPGPVLPSWVSGHDCSVNYFQVIYYFSTIGELQRPQRVGQIERSRFEGWLVIVQLWDPQKRNFGWNES